MSAVDQRIKKTNRDLGKAHKELSGILSEVGVGLFTQDLISPASEEALLSNLVFCVNSCDLLLEIIAKSDIENRSNRNLVSECEQDVIKLQSSVSKLLRKA